MPINKTKYERKTKEPFFIGLTFSHFHYNIIERVCNAISANFAVFSLPENCFTFTLDCTVMPMRYVKGEKGFLVS